MFAEFLLRSGRRPSFGSTATIRICGQLEAELLEERQLLASGPQIFLTAPVLAALQQQAVSNTSAWVAFKAKLDAGLAVVPGGNVYQGSELASISDYALGYQILQTINPATAANYADKAIALMKSALFDYQKDGSITRQFLVRGNGTTKTFTLPNANLIPSSLQVYLAPVTTQAVVHGTLNGQDSIGFYLTALKVSNTPDGNPDYLQGLDWFRNPNLSQDLIDWSLPGKEPSPGATYYVTSASGMTATPVNVTLNGNTITFATAPTTNQAVYVEYVYGTHASNYSTLGYQMTSAGDGGFNSIFIDTTYTSRYLGKHLAMGLDWLWNYPGFSATLKSQVINMLIRWFNYVQTNSYQNNNPMSNYGAGSYDSRVMTALALLNRDPSGPTLLSQVLTWRQNYLIPALSPPAGGSGSLSGGFYAEGWNYGPLATENLLLAGLALESAGQIPAATAERTWASQVIDSLISSQPTASTVYDGGDWYAFPSPFPSTTLFTVLAAAANDPVAQSYANYIIQSKPAQNSFLSMLFVNPSAPASSWGSFPLQYYADGTGLVTARADWSYNSTWLAFQLGNLVGAGHESYSPGQLQIQRGADDLLVNANAVGGNQALSTKSSFSNLIAINDNGAGYQNYPWNMGVWYGSPGVFISNYEATANYVYVDGDYRAAYSKNTNPGGGGPATQLTRQVVYLRPDFIIVHDRAGTVLASFSKQLQWHFLNPVTVSGNSWIEAVGNSKLFGDSFSSVPLTTTTYPVVDNGATVYRVATNNTSAALNVQYTTALETAPSSVAGMVATWRVVSTNGLMEGVQEGNDLVLFGTTGPVTSTSISYSVNGSGSIYNLLTDLQPNQTYKVYANGSLLATLTSSSQGTISFTTPTGTTGVTVTTTGGGTGNPVPSLGSLSQTSAVEGAGSFVLTVNGTGFISSSVVQWNSTPLTTTFVSSTQLKATVPASDLAEEGSDNITVFNPAPGGGTSAASAFTITDAALTASGVAISATEGLSFSGQVATFTDANPAAPLTDFTTGSGGATINWGNGSTSAGTVSQPGGVGTQFDVTGSHTYSDQGSYTVTVTIADLGGSSKSVTATATIADATLTGTGSSIQTKPGVPFSGQVATFTDANPSAPLSDFTSGSGGATINWGTTRRIVPAPLPNPPEWAPSSW
jgi:hypothetical protein